MAGLRIAAVLAIAVSAAMLATFATAAPTIAEHGMVRGTVTVKRPTGVPTGPILVYVVGFTEPPPTVAGSISQRGKRFVPDLVAITAGQSITFPNKDPLLHNVFSPTADRTFDLGSFRQGDSRTRKFPDPGVIEVYCNIHPEMSATLVVVPNRKFTLTGADGRFEIADLPVGTWQIFAYSRHALGPARARITITASATATVSLALQEADRDFSHRDKYGEKYRGDAAIYPPD